MKRSTKTAPVALSTSYLIGSPCIGISTTTLQSLGTSEPAGTRSRLMRMPEAGYVCRSRRARLYRPPAGRTLRFPAARSRAGCAPVISGIADVDVPRAREFLALRRLKLAKRTRRTPRPDPSGGHERAGVDPCAGTDACAALDGDVVADARAHPDQRVVADRCGSELHVVPDGDASAEEEIATRA